MQTFDTINEAWDAQRRDDAYSSDEIFLSKIDLYNLSIGKVLYHNFDDKSCVLYADVQKGTTDKLFRRLLELYEDSGTVIEGLKWEIPIAEFVDELEIVSTYRGQVMIFTDMLPYADSELRKRITEFCDDLRLMFNRLYFTKYKLPERNQL